MQRKVTYRLIRVGCRANHRGIFEAARLFQETAEKAKTDARWNLSGDQGVRKTRRLQAGDQLTICVRDETPSPNTEPEPIPLSIVYEDEDLIVLDKPAGWPSILPWGITPTPWPMPWRIIWVAQKIPYVWPDHESAGSKYQRTDDCG